MRFQTKQTYASEQCALGAEHGERHESAVRMTGDENPRWVGDAPSDQIGDQIFQKSDVVRDAACATKNLSRQG